MTEHQHHPHGDGEDPIRSQPIPAGSIFYPDNDKRQARAEGLIVMIGTFQDNVKRSAEGWLEEDLRLRLVLDSLAKRAGFNTVDEYAEHGLNILKAKDKARFAEMRDAMLKGDSELATSTLVAGALATIGAGVGLSALIVQAFVMDRWMVVMGMRAFAQGVAKIVRGSIEAGSRLIGIAVKGLAGVYKAASAAGTAGATALKFFKVVGKFLTMTAFLLEILNLIAQAVTGAQARDKLRDAIKEYASRRFSAYASQLKVDKIKSFKSEADTLIRVTEVYKELVEDGTLTQQRADEKLKKKFEDLQETFSVEMIEVNDEKVLKDLADLDVNINAWTKEDPSLGTMLEWIEAHENDDAAAFAGEEEIPDVQIAPWNWNPEGISSEQFNALGPRALDYKAFLVRNKT